MSHFNIGNLPKIQNFEWVYEKDKIILQFISGHVESTESIEDSKINLTNALDDLNETYNNLKKNARYGIIKLDNLHEDYLYLNSCIEQNYTALLKRSI